MGSYGQDWSSYQEGQPDTSGLAFAFVKITEGLGYTNPRWVTQRNHAKANGLVWGGYHYPHMANDPHAEADAFLAKVAWQPGDLIILDWEGYDPANSGVSKADQLAYKDAWLRYVKTRMPDHPVGMYCNTDYWRNVDTSSYYADFLWIATSGRPAGDPGIQAPWLFHQFTDTPVDTDYCHLAGPDELRSWAMSFTPTTTPTPAPPAEEDPMAAFTEQDIRRFIREEVTSIPVRDELAFANGWWLQKALTGTPVTGADPTSWGALLPKLTAALGQLPPTVLTQLQTAITEALKTAAVHLPTGATEPTAPTIPGPSRP